MSDLTPRSSSESAAQMLQLVLPNDTNPLGFVLGGTVMHWIDVVAAVAAHRHARRLCVTASMDDLSFEAPIPMGHVAHLMARVTHVSRSSMEVRVDVESENLSSGGRRHTSTAFVTFVAIDDKGKPVPVPPLLVGPGEEKEHAAAVERYQARLARRRTASSN